MSMDFHLREMDGRTSGSAADVAQYRTSTPFVAAIVVLLYFGWRGDTEGRVA